MHQVQINLRRTTLALLTLICLSVVGYAGQKVKVSNVTQLYAAVNNPANAGAEIRLDDGEYVLSPTHTKKGRLELQEGMTLKGKNGNHLAIINALLLTDSFDNGLRTGPIRIGKGENSIENLTIKCHGSAAACIETDLFSGNMTTLVVKNVITEGGMRGVDVRNIGTAMVGRDIEIEIRDSEFRNASSQGIRIVNISGANMGHISAALRDNRSHNNGFGILIANNGVSSSTIQVESDGDVFDQNGVGCLIFGGAATSGVANSNAVNVKMKDGSINNNSGSLDEAGGLTVVGGEESGGSTASNTVTLELDDMEVVDNVGQGDFLAFGAREFPVTGTNNRVHILLKGDSQSLEIVVVENPENTVSIED